MKFNELNIDVSRLVFGTATPALFAAVADGAGEAEEKIAFEILDSVYDAGVNTFDCAAHYGEEILGRWMQVRGNREKCVVITKCAHPNKWRTRVTEYDILSDVHDSLAKLGSDYIDIYMLHRDDHDVPAGEIVEVLNNLYNEGKIKAFGGSNWTHERIQEANEYAKAHNLQPFTVSSPNFGLAEQVGDPWRCDAALGAGCVTISGPENKSAREWYKENNMAVFAYSSLARGFFSGAFKSTEPEKAKEIMDEPGITGYYADCNIERLRRCEILADKYDCTVAQIALAWLYNQPMKVFALSSPVTTEQLEQNIRAMNIKLSADECDWIDLRKEEL